MKQILILGVFLAFICLANVSACTLDATLVSQDPYPVQPDNYVKLVFQLNGTESPDCEGAVFEIVLSYPFSLDENESRVKTLASSTYLTNYKKSWMIPYRIRIDKDAIDGDNEIEVKFSKGGIKISDYSKKFNVNIEDLRADFEVSVKDYDKTTDEITFEILNIGKNDVEALTVELPEQENLVLSGSTRNIAGSLDSNEEITVVFNAVPKRGDINLTIIYTDAINVRRSLSKTVYFNPEYFNQQGASKPVSFYLLVILIAIIVAVFLWKKFKRKKHRAGFRSY